MKKLLVALLVLAFVGAFAFADGAAAPTVQLSGGLETGLMYQQTGSADGKIMNYDFWNAGAVASEWLDFNYDNGDYGFAAEIWNGDFTVTDGTVPSWDQLELYGKFFDGKLKAEFGMIGNNSYTTLGDMGTGWSGWDNSTSGVLLNVMPVDGLKVGYYVPVTTAGALVKDTLNSSNLMFVYSIPNTAKVQGQYWIRDNKAARVYASVAVSAIPNVKLNAELKMLNLGASTGGTTTITQTAGYTMGNIYAGLVAYEYLFSDSGSTLGFSVKPKATYTMGEYTFGGYAKYSVNATAGSSTTTNGVDVGANVKFAAANTFTAWVGLDYNMKDTSDSSQTVLSIPLSVMASF